MGSGRKHDWQILNTSTDGNYDYVRQVIDVVFAPKFTPTQRAALGITKSDVRARRAARHDRRDDQRVSERINQDLVGSQELRKNCQRLNRHLTKQNHVDRSTKSPGTRRAGKREAACGNGRTQQSWDPYVVKRYKQESKIVGAAKRFFGGIVDKIRG